MIRQLTSRITYKKHTIFVCFLFWEPASSYSPGPASQTPSPAGTALPRCPCPLAVRSAFRSRYGAGFCLFQSLIFFPRRLTARGCALTCSSVNLAGHGDFNHAFCSYPIVDIKQKAHGNRVLFVLETGVVILSRAVSSQVPSALMSLTSVFGMRTGGTSSP